MMESGHIESAPLACVAQIAQRLGFTVEQIMARGRAWELVEARQICYLALRQRFAGLTQVEIGQIVGGRGHSTVQSGLMRLAIKMEDEPHFARHVRRVIEGMLGHDLAVTPSRLTRRAVADAFGLDEYLLVGRSRKASIVVARHACCFVLKERFPSLSLGQIAVLMGGRDHTTIIHALHATRRRMARDPVLRVKVEALIGGRIPVMQDAHLLAWIAAGVAAARTWTAVVQTDGEAEDAVQKLWCGQCDYAVTQGEAARCRSRFCSLRGAASSSAASGQQRRAA